MKGQSKPIQVKSKSKVMISLPKTSTKKVIPSLISKIPKNIPILPAAQNFTPQLDFQLPQKLKLPTYNKPIYQSKYPAKNNKYTIPQQPKIHNEAPQLFFLSNKDQDKDKQVVAVIVTINSCGSYDHLFAEVQQKSQEGTRVLVYEATTTYIERLIMAFQGNLHDEIAKSMMENIAKIHPSCVVFNWECCGAYTKKTFLQGRDKVFKFLKIILDKGHMAMFSDFSLKALIKEWDTALLGPNPFVETGQTSNPIDMRFKTGDLKECPSAQLQIVGEMAVGGYCHLAVMDATICYSVNSQSLKHDFYKLQVLSVSTKTQPKHEKLVCDLDGQKGSACHVLLTYPSGGVILTSMGHWIELMKIDTSEEKLFEVAEQNFGKEYADSMKKEFGGLKLGQQKDWISKNAVSFVQKQAPCANMRKRATGLK